MKSADREPEVLRRYSPRLVRAFTTWLKGYFRKNFDGVRLSLEGLPPEDDGGPLVVYANHPSWWDPIHFLLLSGLLFPGRRMFGPFEADALAKYPLLRRFGAFGIDRSRRRGAVEFLATSRAILAEPDAMLWITAQGEFRDPRSRPVELQPGVAHLAGDLPAGRVVPLAIEYPFWNERRPEALSRFGPPIPVGELREMPMEERNALLALRLTKTIDALAGEAESRDPDRFRTLVLGRAGVGGVYDVGRMIKAWVRGRSLETAHEDERR